MRIFSAAKNELYKTLFWIIICLGGVIVFFSPTENWSWDPSYYYAQIRSPIIENDLDFRNETITNGVATRVTVTGLQGSAWPVGPSLLWAPFFLLAHFIVLLINPAKATGFSFPYISLVSFGSALYGMIGVLILYKICRYYGNKYISIITTVLCLGATPLFYYIFRQPLMAHSTGFLVSAIMFLFYIRLTDNQISRDWSGLTFGVLLGLNFLMRWTGILFAIFPVTYFATQIIKAVREKNSPESRFLIKQICIMIAGFGLMITPQMALWYRLYGKFLVIPQGASTFVANILPINTLKVFFDTNRGLLFWSPFVLIGMIGIVRIPKLEIRISAAICFVSQVVLIGYRADWFSGGVFGARYFIELLPMLAVGFICLVRGFSMKTAGQLLLAVCTIVLVVHQSVLIYAVEHPFDGYIDIVKYILGQPLGVRWQLNSFIMQFRNPGLWLKPWLYGVQDRQTILINLVAGVRDLRAYRIPGTAALLTPFAVIGVLWIRKYTHKINLLIILLGVIMYMVAWSFYYLVVG